MTDKTISALTNATTPLAGTELLPIVQSGATVKVSVNNLTVGKTVTMSGADITSAGGTLVQITGGAASGSSLYFKTGTNVLTAFGDAAQITGGLANTKATIYTGGGIPLSIAVTGADRFVFDTNFNLVVSTANRGIGFTSNTPTAGMTSQILTWYEEGTWTPNQGAGLTVVGAFSSTGKYTRIGRSVTISGTVTGATSVAVTAAGVITSNLPFTAGTAGHGSATNATSTAFASIICTTTNVTSAGAIAATATITFSATYFV